MSKVKREYPCVNYPREFCFVCGVFVTKKTRRKFSDLFQQKYEHYFGIVAENLDKWWTPSFLCQRCSSNLSFRNPFKFDKPMIWSEPDSQSHVTDCYFCISRRIGFGKNVSGEYPKKSTCGFELPVLQSDRIAHPELRGSSYNSSRDATTSNPSRSTDSEKTPKRMTQVELNNLVTELNLSKEKAQILATVLKERGCVEDIVLPKSD